MGDQGAEKILQDEKKEQVFIKKNANFQNKIVQSKGKKQMGGCGRAPITRNKKSRKYA